MSTRLRMQILVLKLFQETSTDMEKIGKMYKCNESISVGEKNKEG